MESDNIVGNPISDDFEQITNLLPITGRQSLLELGCGPAETTRKLAERFPDLEVIATEVDQIQHAKNLEAETPANIGFQFGGAEDIQLPDSSVDYVVMLKSLHHVSIDLMMQGLHEIGRVLKPGGLAYISEPVYAGEFNDILKLFHDEKNVRQAAIDAIQDVVDAKVFQRVKQFRFDTLLTFQGFEDFEKRIIGVTHTEFDIDEALLKKIEAAFASSADAIGVAEFRAPNRIDLLCRPNAV